MHLAVVIFFIVVLQGSTGTDKVLGRINASTLEFDAVLGRALEAVLDVYVPDSPTVEAACRAHARLLRRGVREGQLWALHMVDASSKLPSGLLTGNLAQLGNVDQCLAVRHWDAEHGPITGQHCLVSLGANNSLSANYFVDKLTAGSLTGTGLDEVEALLAQGRFGDALSEVGATWSLCVPASCSPGDLERHLRATLPGRLQVRIDHRACHASQDPQGVPGLGERVVTWLLFCACALVAAGTAYDLLTGDATPRNQHLLAFSLRANGHALLKTTSNAEHFASVHGLRTVTIVWSILIHHFISYTNAAAVNYRTLEAKTRGWVYLPVSNGSLAVDSMFVLSGALVAYNFMRDRQRSAKFSLWRYYIHRYARLTPMLLVALFLSATVARHISDSPATRRNSDRMQASCAAKGWLVPLYLSNYLDDELLCMTQAWSTCVDMHLFWLSPLLLFPLWRSPRAGLSLLLAVSVALTAFVFREAFVHQLTPLNSFLNPPYSQHTRKLYMPTHARATPWLVGVGLGWLLHTTRGRKDALSAKQAFLGWTSCALLTSYAFLTAHEHFQADAQPGRMRTALYVAAMRPAWALGVAWLLLACERGRGGAVNAFLSWPGWQVTSRLSFGVYLTNLVLAAGLPMHKKAPQFYDEIGAMVEFFGLVVLSFSSAAWLHFLVEAPCDRLYRASMRTATTPTPTPTPKKAS